MQHLAQHRGTRCRGQTTARRSRSGARALHARASHAQAEAQTILTQAKQEAERFAKESEAQLKALVERRARQAQDRIARAEAQAMAEIAPWPPMQPLVRCHDHCQAPR